MKDVAKVPLDNPPYRFFRKLALRIDNALFNRNGGGGDDYQPTRHVLVLPYICGIAAASYVFFSSFAGDRADSAQVERNILLCVPLMILLNIVLHLKNLFVFRGWIRKISYPVFIAVSTVVFFAAVTFVCAWIYAIVMIVLVLWIVWTAHFGKGGTLTSSGGDAAVRREVLVDDGSFWGKTLTSTDCIGEWRDRFGNIYEESGGEFRKK